MAAILAVVLCGLTVGLVLGSQRLALAASLVVSPAVYVHYHLTSAARLVSEPQTMSRALRWPIGRHRQREPEGTAQKARP